MIKKQARGQNTQKIKKAESLKFSACKTVATQIIKTIKYPGTVHYVNKRYTLEMRHAAKRDGI
jgi:hypothetical protein